VSGLGPITLRVQEVLPLNSKQTTPTPADFTLVSGTNITGLNFGNPQPLFRLDRYTILLCYNQGCTYGMKFSTIPRLCEPRDLLLHVYCHLGVEHGF
jgi:hypothetical protein